MKNVWTLIAFVFVLFHVLAHQKGDFRGLDMNMGNLYRLSDAKTRSISPENFSGEKEKGAMATLEEGVYGYQARELGQGWKVIPLSGSKQAKALYWQNGRPRRYTILWFY